MQRSMSKQYSPVMTCRSDGGVAVAYLGGVCGMRPGAPRVPRALESTSLHAVHKCFASIGKKMEPDAFVSSKVDRCWLQGVEW